MQGTGTGPLELISLDEIKKVLRNSLALENDVEIEENTKLIDLNVELIDVLDIYFRLGMDFSKYISGERLNQEGVDFLKKVGKSLGLNDHHYQNLANSKTTNAFINQLLVKDLVEINNYERIYKK